MGALIVGGWVALLAGLAWWSVGHSPATVPEQRSIAQAVPELQRAVGVVFATADGSGRAVVLGGLTLTPGCRITPVRSGVTATRDVTVYVPPDRARDELTAIAAALPASYRAWLTPDRGATRLDLHADAGNFVGIDADADVGAAVLVLHLSGGCRPSAPGGLHDAGPSAAPPPTVLAQVRRALGAQPVGAVATQAVACPSGGAGETYTVEGLAATADVGSRVRTAIPGLAVVREERGRWAYRSGAGESVVVSADHAGLRLDVTTPCGMR